MTEAPRKQTVTSALASCMALLPGIGKDDRSPEGYSYRGIEAVTRQLQPLLAAHGVVISPRATITNVVPSPAMKDGWQDVFMTVEWTITGPDGSTLIAQTTGIGRDRADKGANKAQTQAFKYLLLHLFCIADGKDDVDQHNYDQDRAVPAPPPPFDLDKFKQVCDENGVDPTDVVGHAGLGKKLAELTEDDRPALKASLAELAAKAVDAGGGSGDNAVGSNGNGTPSSSDQVATA